MSIIDALQFCTKHNLSALLSPASKGLVDPSMQDLSSLLVTIATSPDNNPSLAEEDGTSLTEDNVTNLAKEDNVTGLAEEQPIVAVRKSVAKKTFWSCCYAYTGILQS